VTEVYQAISAVAKDLCATGISKDQFNQAQKFKFRGIDDTLAALSPLLVKHGLVILPRVTGLNQVGRDGTNAKGEPKFTMHTTVNVEYTFVSVKDGSEHTCVVAGEAADSGDKGVAKALSMAFKYLIFQAFAVPTEGQGHDPDAETVEFQTKTATAKVTETRKSETHESKTSTVTEAQRLELVDLLTKAKVDVKIFLEHYGASGLSAFPADQFADASSRLKQRVGEAEADAALAGNSTAASDKPAESQPATTGAGKAADAGSASGAGKPKNTKVGPRVSRFRGVR